MLKRGEAAFDEKDDTPGPISLVVLAEIERKPAAPAGPEQAADKEAEDTGEDQEHRKQTRPSSWSPGILISPRIPTSACPAMGTSF